MPADLQDRRVEITGPVDRKMVINALNSGAKMYMADFEDSHSPTWEATIEGQINLRDAVRGTIEYTNAEGKQYALDKQTATLLVRPRGWHLEEKHVLVDGQPMSAGMFDFGLYFFHNAQALMEKGSGPYFYLPKLESHLEARLWNDVFNRPRRAGHAARHDQGHGADRDDPGRVRDGRNPLGAARALRRAQLRRWDYIFSFIKKFRNRPEFVLPDRAQVTMTTHFLRSYSQLLIKTCHRRGAHAMGGMAAQIPIKNDPAANEPALAKVRADKEREVSDGHDGTWVAHPGLVGIAMEVFDQHDVRAESTVPPATKRSTSPRADLLQVPEGAITPQGLRTNVAVGLRYLETWLRGNGCVPIFNLMEDAATAEISRAQIWQWIRHPAGRFDDGTKITVELVRGHSGRGACEAIREPWAKSLRRQQVRAAGRAVPVDQHRRGVRRVPHLPAYETLE